jgi:hypothetical protein
MTNIVNSAPYLREAREFPEDARNLSFQANKAYLETANAVNQRTIGLYPANRPAITGNSYFFTPNRQQSLRQIYSFTGTTDINLGFKLSTISGIIQGYGSYTDGTSFYGLIFGTSVAVAGLVSFFITVNTGSTTTDLIRFETGAGAPSLVSGSIVLEWIVEG